MKTSKKMMSLLLLSALCITPAYANWFHNPVTNVSRNIGSAPNPTPQDLRALYGHGPMVTAMPSRPHAVPYGEGYLNRGYDLSSLEGRTVFGPERTVIPAYVKLSERLGYILAVDQEAKLAELQTPAGIAVTVPVALLVPQGDRVMAPTMTRADVMAMAKTQTGRTVALNIDHRTRVFRG